MAPGLKKVRYPLVAANLLIGILSLLAGCAGPTGTGAGGPLTEKRAAEIEDLQRIPQSFRGLAEAAQENLQIDASCRGLLLQEFRRNFFLPWTSDTYLTDPEEVRTFMKQEVNGRWFLVNKRRIDSRQMQRIVENCDLEHFPSRRDIGIAVAPGHLRGLPTRMPFYERADSMPFDMLSYPQVKLNEPLRVLHRSGDGVWLFVETVYSNGWIEARDVALVDREFAERWMQGPHLVITRDYAPVGDGRGHAAYPAKIGTILPLVTEGREGWEVSVASAGEGGKAELRTVRFPREWGAPFPLGFEGENIVRIGEQLLGEPYGWGELYGLRDCSALLRDFFLPFGIWLPRTSSDQIGSVPARRDLGRLAAQEKEEVIRKEALPFQTLIFKPGHITLFVGYDAEGRPLVFQDAWSIQLRNGEKGKSRTIGSAVITTLEPGKELGLVPGTSLLEKATDLGTITSRCGPGEIPALLPPTEVP